MGTAGLGVIAGVLVEALDGTAVLDGTDLIVLGGKTGDVGVDCDFFDSSTVRESGVVGFRGDGGGILDVLAGIAGFRVSTFEMER